MDFLKQSIKSISDENSSWEILKKLSVNWNRKNIGKQNIRYWFILKIFLYLAANTEPNVPLTEGMAWGGPAITLRRPKAPHSDSHSVDHAVLSVSIWRWLGTSKATLLVVLKNLCGPKYWTRFGCIQGLSSYIIPQLYWHALVTIYKINSSTPFLIKSPIK